MRALRLRCAGAELLADPSGALIWPQHELLIVADLHLEKGSHYAARGTLLPPYDTRSTLDRLEEVLARWAPRRVISLGDAFHDREAVERLGSAELARLARLVGAQEWIWLRGNHDPDPPQGLGGEVADALETDGLVFRHLPAQGASGIVGHLHPTASVTVRGRRLSRRCFVFSQACVILPAFGSYAGGLDVFDPAIADLFDDGFQVALMGDRRLHPLPLERLDRPPPSRCPALQHR